MSDTKIASRVYGFKLRNEKFTFMFLLRPYATSLAFGCLLLFITNLIMVCLPLLINGGVSLIERDQDFIFNIFIVAINFSSIYWVLIAIVGFAIVGATMRTLSRVIIFDVGRTIERDIRKKLFFQISVLDEQFFLERSVGDLMNHLTTDVSSIRMVTGFAALNIVNIIFVFCFTVPLLLKIDFLLALVALLPFPLVMITTAGITKRMFHATIDYQAKLSRLVNHIQENLLGAHVVRLFHQQNQEAERFEITNHLTYEAGVKLARIRVLMMPVMRLMVGVSVGLVLYVGGNKVFANEISLGDFVEVNARILQLAWPAMSVGFVMSVISRGQASLQRINDLLDYMPIIKDGQHVLTQVERIDVHNLSLRKPGTINFSLKRGQMLGIVGPSGSYKSTMLKAIYRRKLIADGIIFFDENDINNISLSSLYSNISVVLQEPFLFQKSIRENISFQRPDASLKEIDEVIKLVRLDLDFANLSYGIDTIVGERGITLSGGQRQRVALARALLAKRPVIILDDALSSVDANTESHIVSHLRDYLGDAIIIMATHRLFAIRDADEILVMEKGFVKQKGKHEELLRKSSLYQSLWGIEGLGHDR
jgi:ATP-binding cassette, subfamily B, multidrug efflux pump